MTCERYNPNEKNSSLFINSYEGIPENFIINICLYFGLICVFIFLRKKTWTYSDLALLSKPIDVMEVGPIRESVYNSIDKEEIQNEVAFSGSSLVNRLWSKLPLFIKMSDQLLEKRCGDDAVIYCVFQRRLMFIGFVMMLSSLIIVVPLNFEGNYLSNRSSSFNSLTIANIGYESNIPIVHLCITLVLMILTFVITYQFINFANTKRNELTSTLMITNIPEKHCDETLILNHIKEAYPSVNVLKVQQTYEIEGLFELYIKKVIAEEALVYCCNKLETRNEHVMVETEVFGRASILCKCCQRKSRKPMDGIQYYTSEVQRITELFVNEKMKTLNSKTLPIFFITLENMQQALLIRREYAYQNYCCVKQISKSASSLSLDILSDQWKVFFASASKDILWQNLHKHGWKLWLVNAVVNIFVAFFVIMLSTPAVVLQTWSTYDFGKHLKINNNVFASQLAPSLVMVLVSGLMPWLVCFSNDLSAHWTKTKQNIGVMNKLFVVLIVTILILPSLGLNSIPKLVVFFFKNDTTSLLKSQLNCIFMADGGALFCNYLISAAFIGMGFEILRLGELFSYVIKLFSSRSRAENYAIAKSLLWEFPFGINYAWTLSLFAIVSAYAVIVPLITPFGLAYLISKHLVDRYNLIHVNIKTKVDNDVHINATTLLHVCMVFTQATITAFIYLRRGLLDKLVISGIFLFFLGIILTLARILRTSLSKMAWVKYYGVGKVNDEENALRIEANAFPRPDEENTDSVFLPMAIKQSENYTLTEAVRRISVLIPSASSAESQNTMRTA